MNEKIDIGIIGGTGVYDPGLLTNTKQIKVYTPFGMTSDLITTGEYADRKIAFIPRHGTCHHIPPHHVPYRANIWALKQLGVTRILAPCAVGSLHADMPPGDIVIPDQFYDVTKNRQYTYYDGGEVGHISMADPFCSELRELTFSVAKNVGATVHPEGTNVCIQGPRYSTRAESLFYRDAVNAHTIGMTLVPECLLARELEICYVSISAVTDFDAWHEDKVDTASVIKCMKKNVHTLRNILTELIPLIPIERDHCECPHALENAIV